MILNSISKNRLILSFCLLVLGTINSYSQRQREATRSDSSILSLSTLINLGDTTDDMDDLKWLDSIAGKKKLIITGEDHRYMTSNREIENRIFKYLNKNHGYRVLIRESGFVTAWFYDRYVRFGDTVAKDVLYRTFNYGYLTQLEEHRAYYLSLKDEQKFTVKGVDIERNVPMFYHALFHLIPKDQEIDDSLLFYYHSIKTVLTFYNDIELKAKLKTKNSYYFEWEPDSLLVAEYKKQFKEEYKLIDAMYQRTFNRYYMVKHVVLEFRRLEKEMKLLYGSQYEMAEKVIREMEAWMRWEDYDDEGTPYNMVYREQVMFDRLNQIVREDPEAKIFGQYGRCHTMFTSDNRDCDYGYFFNLVNRMESKYPQSVYNIAIFYVGHNRMIENLEGSELVRYKKLTQDGQARLFLTNGLEENSRLKQRFNAFIINKWITDSLVEIDDSEDEEEDEEDIKDAKVKKQKAEELEGFNINLGLRAWTYNLFEDFEQGASDVAMIQPYIGFSFNNLSKKNNYFNMEFGYAFVNFDKSNMGFQNRTSTFSLHFGKDLIKARKGFFIPYVGSTAALSRMNVRDNTKVGALGEPMNSLYSFFSATLDAGGTIGWVSKNGNQYGIDGRYGFQPYNNYWRAANQPVSTAERRGNFYLICIKAAFNLD